MMQKFKGLMTSLKSDYQTPKAAYDILNKEFNFDFDPCPIDPQFNGLEIEWGKRNFVNPPYGRAIFEWIRKGVKESRKGKLVVFLIPCRTDTRWWHNWIMDADEIRFIEGRLRFSGYETGAPFPSCIAIFKGGDLKCQS